MHEDNLRIFSIFDGSLSQAICVNICDIERRAVSVRHLSFLLLVLTAHRSGLAVRSSVIERTLK